MKGNIHCPSIKDMSQYELAKDVTSHCRVERSVYVVLAS